MSGKVAGGEWKSSRSVAKVDSKCSGGKRKGFKGEWKFQVGMEEVQMEMEEVQMGMEKSRWERKRSRWE